MKKEKTLSGKMTCRQLLADVTASVLFLTLSILLVNGASPIGRGMVSFSNATWQWMSMFMGAADTSLDASTAISKVQPVYPEIAKRMNISGVVEVEVTVDESGKVTDATAVNGPAMLRASAEAALKQWKFKPGGGKGKISVRFGN